VTGKILAACIILAALIAGGSIYYLQVYAYYTTVAVHGSEDVMLTAQASGQPEAITYRDFQAIDSDSSPIRYRGCFTTTQSPETLAQSYHVMKKPNRGSRRDGLAVLMQIVSAPLWKVVTRWPLWALKISGTASTGSWRSNQMARVMSGIGSIGAAKSFLRAEQRPLIALNLRKVTDYA